MNNKIYDYKLKKIRWYEKILLLFRPMVYVQDNKGNIISKVGYKHMFGKVYVLKENISIERTNNE